MQKREAVVEVLVAAPLEGNTSRRIVAERRGRGLRAARRDDARDLIVGAINPGGCRSRLRRAGARRAATGSG